MITMKKIRSNRLEKIKDFLKRRYNVEGENFNKLLSSDEIINSLEYIKKDHKDKERTVQLADMDIEYIVKNKHLLKKDGLIK